MSEKDNTEFMLYKPHLPDKGRTALCFTVNVGAPCNLRCDYCHYEGLSKDHPMSEFELETMLERIAEYITSSPKEYHQIVLLWHGGEPLLLGRSFFKSIIDLEQELFHSSIKIINRIQTNGTLVDDWHAEFFAKNKFDVALSFDGSHETHDRHRKDIKGDPTSSRVINGAKVLKKYGINLNIRTIIREDMLDREQEIYHYLKSFDSDYVDILPGLNTRDPKCNLDPNIYAKFMINMFKVWTGKEGAHPEIRFLKSCVSKMLGFPGKSVLDFKTTCGGAPEIWWRGDIQYCIDAKGPDFYLGNIYIDDLTDILSKSDDIKKSLFKQRNKCFESCEWSHVCEGGCPIAWHDGHNHFCEAYQKLFPVVKEFAEKIRGRCQNG